MRPILPLAALALVAVTTTPSQAVVVVVTGTSNGFVENFLNTNFTNVTEIRSGDFALFSSAATQTALAGADLVIIGRTLSSGAYDNGDSDGYNTLSIPVVSLTSYVARESGNRLGWHTGGATNNVAVLPGDTGETLLTVAGAALFGGVAGPADYFGAVAGDTFNGLGGSTLEVGGGQVLATIGGQLQSAYWAVGDAPGSPTDAGVATFPGERLLFNLDNDPAPATDEFSLLTPAGQSALISGLVAVSDLEAVPEPAALGLVWLAGLSLLGRRRR